MKNLLTNWFILKLKNTTKGFKNENTFWKSYLSDKKAAGEDCFIQKNSCKIKPVSQS